VIRQDLHSHSSRKQSSANIAHIADDGREQTLKEHLEGTAVFAKQFAEDFNSTLWAYTLGMLHDLGKGTPEWQNYLLNSGSRVEHSIYGAKFAEDKFGRLSRFLSYPIAGHHAGLPDYTGAQSSLSFRLQNAVDRNLSSDVEIPKTLPWKFDVGLDVSLWIRMLFSCLIDADRLDTERFCNPDQYEKRGSYLSIDKLHNTFEEYMSDKINSIKEQDKNSIVFKSRQTVLEDCKTSSEQDTGFFSLTVPTGGGKTLSSMAFALNHAKKHNKKRIIYVIPYTSIIEQNADVFKNVFGEDQVIEHHSNIDVDDQKERAKLATENWDAPIIITTTVQFYESLFSAKTSKCRKLHNIANSVVILDEAQLIPTEFLIPILETLKLLTTRYKTSAVFCTATQQAFAEIKLEEIKKLNINPKEIIKDVGSLYNSLQRVTVQMPSIDECRKLGDLAEELRNYEQVLCIVSDRKSAKELHRLMPDGTYHLSALMCAEHRSDKIDEIKEILKNGNDIRVISTQLVEAGVDIDFPVVYRQIAGLDSIAQAAGRCNREGKLKQGKIVVFNSMRKSPPGLLRKATETTQNLPQNVLENPLAPESFKIFFETLYWKANSLDKEKIVALLTASPADLGIQFRDASDKLTIIEDKNQETVIVPYNENAQNYIRMIKHPNSKIPAAVLLRKLQRFSVGVYKDQFNGLRDRGSLEEIFPGVFALNNEKKYNDSIGLLIDDEPDDPRDYMC